jgi:hypothetical protein
MFSRIVVLAAVVAFAAPLVRASERSGEESVEEVRDSLERIAPRLDLTRLFARLADEGGSYETADGVSAPASAFEVVLARIGTDGKPVMACVDNEQSARRFLEAPVDRVQGRKAQDQ